MSKQSVLHVVMCTNLLTHRQTFGGNCIKAVTLWTNTSKHAQCQQQLWAKCRLAAHCESTYQESAGKLCGIFKFWSFLQSKSVNNVCKLLQLLPRPLTAALTMDHTGDLHYQGPLGYNSPKWKFLALSLSMQLATDMVLLRQRHNIHNRGTLWRRLD